MDNFKKCKTGEDDAGPILWGSLRVASVYFLATTVWIIVSDQVTRILAENLDELAVFSMYKGCFFTLTTTLLLFQLVRQYGLSLRKNRNEIESSMAQLIHAERRQVEILNSVPGYIYIKDKDLRYTFGNTEVCSLFGIAPEKLAGMTDRDVFSEETAEKLRQNDLEVIRQRGSILREETNIVSSTGETRTYLSRKIPLYDADGQVVGLCGISTDITEAYHQRTALAKSEEQLRTVIESSPNGILLVDEAGIIRRVNREAESIFGYSREELIGQSVDILVSDASVAHNDKLRQGYAVSHASRHMGPGREVLGRRKSGERVRLEIGLATMTDSSGETLTVTTCVDATERWKAQEEIRRLALFDDLTGVRNRHGLLKSLEHAIELASATGESFGLILLDIDRFRDLNDGYGHDYGDTIIRLLAKRLKARVSNGDVLARVGGDEFAVLVSNIESDTSRLEDVMSGLMGVFDEPYTLEGVQTRITASMGACCYPSDAQNARDLLRCLDIGLYEAKLHGRGWQVLFSDEMGRKASARHQTELALRNALERGEFRVFYQPIYDLATGKIVGAEGLVRWIHPRRGLVMPDDFIGICEETNLIVPLGLWVLESACFQAHAWQQEFGDPFKISINISPKQFADPNLQNDVKRILGDSKLAAGSLQLEITEGLLIADPEGTVEHLSRLQELDVKIAIDDFGTGYSSLSYLNRYPIDCLKVDRSFVCGVIDDPDAATICRAIITLAHSLKMTVVAEGVETTEQEDFLRNLDCEMTQGYLYGRGLSAEDFSHLLAKQSACQKAA